MIYDIPNENHSLLQVLDFDGLYIEIRSTELPRQRIYVMRSMVPSLIEALEKTDKTSHP